MKKLIIALSLLSGSAFAGEGVSCKIQIREDSAIPVKKSINFFPGRYEAEVFDFKDGVKLSAQELNEYTGAYVLIVESEKMEIKLKAYSIENFSNFDLTIGKKSYVALCSRN